MKDKLIIIGASGHGKVIADIAIQTKRWSSIAFLDDNINIKETFGFNVLGSLNEAINNINEYSFIIGIGYNKTRESIQKRLEEANAEIATLIHPDAVIGEQVEIGSGTVIMAGTVINCCSRIGKGCIVNTGATIDHDNFLDDFVHISPGVHTAGSVNIGKLTWAGIGSIISNNVNIVSGCTIGAGSVVLKNITEPGTYVGIPARRIWTENLSTG